MLEDLIHFQIQVIRQILLCLHVFESINATLVVDSEIATIAAFGNGFEWLRGDNRWIQLMDKVAQLKEKERQKRIQEGLPFRDYQRQ